MSPSPHQCSGCQNDLTADRAGGLTYCSRCGAAVPGAESTLYPFLPEGITRQEPEPCSECGNNLHDDRAARRAACSACGAALPPLESATSVSETGHWEATGLNASERKRFRVCFWALFIGTPLATLVVGATGDWVRSILPAFLAQAVPLGLQVLLVSGCGLLGSSYCLTQLRQSKLSGGRFLAAMIMYGFLLGIAYIGIAFVGCMAIGGFMAINR